MLSDDRMSAILITSFACFMVTKATERRRNNKKFWMWIDWALCHNWPCAYILWHRAHFLLAVGEQQNKQAWSTKNASGCPNEQYLRECQSAVHEKPTKDCEDYCDDSKDSGYYGASSMKPSLLDLKKQQWARERGKNYNQKLRVRQHFYVFIITTLFSLEMTNVFGRMNRTISFFVYNRLQKP